MTIPERSVEPDEPSAKIQYVCDVCGDIVQADEYEGEQCSAEYDEASEAIGVPPNYVQCDGTLEPQEIEPWQDRDEE